jgi:sporulation protein YlmC with PRC-barrel domain
MEQAGFRRLAWLENMHVVTEDGKRLGEVFEIRSPGAAETEPTWDARPVQCLLCGHAGLLERLGWKQRTPRLVPWERVLAVRGSDILVRGNADDYKRSS